MANTAIFLAEGFEEIEGLMVVDMLRRAGVNVDMVSISDSLQVNGSHAIPVMADKLIKDIDFDAYDLLVLPGGMPGTIHIGECKLLCDEVVKAYENGKKIAAICAAPTENRHRASARWKAFSRPSPTPSPATPWC